MDLSTDYGICIR